MPRRAGRAGLVLRMEILWLVLMILGVGGVASVMMWLRQQASELWVRTACEIAESRGLTNVLGTGVCVQRCQYRDGGSRRSQRAHSARSQRCQAPRASVEIRGLKLRGLTLRPEGIDTGDRQEGGLLAKWSWAIRASTPRSTSAARLRSRSLCSTPPRGACSSSSRPARASRYGPACSVCVSRDPGPTRSRRTCGNSSKSPSTSTAVTRSSRVSSTTCGTIRAARRASP